MDRKTLIIINSEFDTAEEVCSHEVTLAVIPTGVDPFQVCIFCGKVLKDRKLADELYEKFVREEEAGIFDWIGGTNE